MKSQESMTRIITLMGRFSEQIRVSSELNLRDINVLAENTLIPLFRIVHDYSNLKNLNLTERVSFPAVDLGDETARVAIQVTATPSSSKVAETIRKFVDHKLYERFDRLIVYILTNKQKQYTSSGLEDATENAFVFDEERDIQDRSDLLKIISNLPPEKLKQVVQVLEAEFGDSSQLTKKPTNIPRENYYFTGREEELTVISKALAGAKPVVMHGLGGVGKTQLALKYAHRNREFYDVVWWIRAEEVSTVRADLAQLAVSLGLVNDGLSFETKITLLNQWFFENDSWLLIFDNAVSPKDIGQYLPASTKGKVLLTSVNGFWSSIAKPVKIEVWQMSESVEFLQTRLEDAEKVSLEQASELTNLLGHLPLALEQAAAYIEQTRCGIDEYIRRFRTMREELWGVEKAPLTYKKTVATTWNISMEKLRQESPDAADLLNFIAFLAPNDIPLSLLEDGASDFPNNLPSALKTRLSSEQLVLALARYSLIDEQNEVFAGEPDKMLSVHRLVQTVVRDQLGPEGAASFLEAAIEFVRYRFRFDARNPETWAPIAWLLPHAEAVAEHARKYNVNSEDVSQLLYGIGLWHKHDGQPLQSFKSLKRAKDVLESYSDESHPELPPLLTDLGTAMMSLPPQISIALIAYSSDLFKRSVELERKYHAESDPFRLAKRLDPYGRYILAMGCINKDNGMLHEALEIHKTAYDIAKDLMAQGKEVSPAELATFVNSYANSLNVLGKSEKALAEFGYALELITSDPKAGSEHPDISGIRVNLGLLLMRVGRFEDAELELQKSLQFVEKWFPIDHDQVLSVNYALGQVLILQGKTDEAEKEFLKIPKERLSEFEHIVNTAIVPCLKTRPGKISMYDYFEPYTKQMNTEQIEVEKILEPNQMEHHGAVLTFGFPIGDIPIKGSDPCPCGSGEFFARCHNKDFRKALKANITTRR